MSEMRIVKVRIRRGGPGENMMVYPDRYNAQEVDRMGMGPGGFLGISSYSGHIGRGGLEEWCLIALPPHLAYEYARSSDMEIVTVNETDDLLEKWRIMKGIPEEVVSDPNRIMAIRAKQEAGIKLSAEDYKALDPEDPIPGITKSVRKIGDIAKTYNISFGD